MKRMFGELILYLMEVKGIGISQLSQQSGLALGTLRNLTRGYTPSDPSLATFVKLGEGLSVDPAYLTRAYIELPPEGVQQFTRLADVGRFFRTHILTESQLVEANQHVDRLEAIVNLALADPKYSVRGTVSGIAEKYNLVPQGSS